MPESAHTEGDQKGKFCSLRASKCKPCRNSYKKPCKATAKGWNQQVAGFTSKFRQKYKDGFRYSSQNAHHIACVASVTEIVTRDASLELIVRATKWCVNDASNMIALPLWPHTFEWYVKFNQDDLVFRTERGEPPFKDLAMHDYDHDQYNSDVSLELEQVVKNVKAKKKKHHVAVATLVSQLNNVISSFRGTLTGRNTHQAWLDGVRDNPGWYKAFSLSKANPTAKAFPSSDNELGKKLEETHRLINMGR